MTRPAVNYDSYIRPTYQVNTFDMRGVVTATTSTPQCLERRQCSKSASVKTTPRKGGNYSTPTAYDSSGGFWSSAGSTTYFGYSSFPPPRHPIYRMEFGGSGYADIGFNPRTLYSLPSSITNQLQISALNRLRHSNVNIGVMLAEAKETSSLLVTAATRIAKSVRSFRRKSPDLFLKAIQHQGTASWRKTPQAWLELQYGWKPLMNDLQGAATSLDSSWVRDRDLFAVGAKKKVMDTCTYDTYTAPSTVNCRQTVSVEATQKIQLCYRLSNFHLALLSSLGLTNPLEIIWERVPYSFVVDWFLPVGNWLSALGGDFGYTFINGSLTTFIRYSENGSPVNSSGSDQEFFCPIRGSAYYLRRQIYVSSPWPGLSFKSPVSSGHIANALSLLTQSLRRR